MIRARGLAISGPARRLHDHEAERAAVIKAAENHTTADGRVS
jgi:hypothetical protein